MIGHSYLNLPEDDIRGMGLVSGMLGCLYLPFSSMRCQDRSPAPQWFARTLLQWESADFSEIFDGPDDDFSMIFNATLILDV